MKCDSFKSEYPIYRNFYFRELSPMSICQDHNNQLLIPLFI